MTIPPLELQGQFPQGLQFLQDNLLRWTENVTPCPLLDGYLEEGVAMPAAIGNVVFQHNLGRVPVGMLPVYHTGRSDYSIVSWDSRQITINWPYATAATFNFWIF